MHYAKERIADNMHLGPNHTVPDLILKCDILHEFMKKSVTQKWKTLRTQGFFFGFLILKLVLKFRPNFWF